MELGRPHQHQADQHGQVRAGVDGEAPAVAERHHQQAGQGRPEQPGEVDDRAVEHDRVRDVLGPDHLGHERAPQRVVEGEQDPPAGGQRVQPGQRWPGQEGQDGQADRLGHLQALGHQQQAPLVRPVGDRPGPGRQQQDRAELEAGQDPHAQAAPGEPEHQQGEGDVGQPVAGVGDQLPDEEQPEVAVPQGQERPPHAGASARRSSSVMALSRASCSSGPMVCSTAPTSHALREARIDPIRA